MSSQHPALLERSPRADFPGDTFALLTCHRILEYLQSEYVLFQRGKITLALESSCLSLNVGFAAGWRGSGGGGEGGAGWRRAHHLVSPASRPQVEKGTGENKF